MDLPENRRRRDDSLFLSGDLRGAALHVCGTRQKIRAGRDPDAPYGPAADRRRLFSAPDLQQAIIAEANESRLSMADKILDAMGNWRIRLDGYGSIFVEPIDKKEVTVFDQNNNDVIETDIEITYDWYNAPNVVRASLDGSYAEAKDEDPYSPLSIQNRGREVWLSDSNVSLSMNETLAEYTQRMLKYYQQVSTTISYSRRFVPDVYPSDIVRINYPGQGINGLFMSSNQSITLGYNART